VLLFDTILIFDPKMGLVFEKVDTPVKEVIIGLTRLQLSCLSTFNAVEIFNEDEEREVPAFIENKL
jgi:hypothetical protein